MHLAFKGFTSIRSIHHFLYILVTLTLYSCAGSGVTPTSEIRSAHMAEWSSDFDVEPVYPQANAIPGGGFIAISQKNSNTLSIEEFSPVVELRRSTTVILDDDEEYARIYTFKGLTLLLTQLDEGDGVRSVLMRKIDFEAPSVDRPTKILITSADFDEDFEFTSSPDSSWIFVYGVGDDFDAVSRDGTETPNVPYCLATIDMRSGTASGRCDTVAWHEDYDDEMIRTAAISNDGEGVLMEIISLGDDRFDLAVHRTTETGIQRSNFSVPNRGDSLLPDYDKARRMTPTSMAAAYSREGRLSVMMNLSLSSHLSALLEMRPNLSAGTVRSAVPIAWSEENIELVTDDEKDELENSYQIRRVLPHEDGSRSVILESRRSKSGTKIRNDRYENYTVQVYDPIIVVHFSVTDELLSHFYVPREEAWPDSKWLAFEGSHTSFAEDGTVYIMVRQRRSDGILLYSLDMSAGSMRTTKIAEAGGRALLATRYTLWHPGGRATLFVKSGPMGKGWKVVNAEF